MNDRDFEKLELVEFDFEREWVPKRAKKLRPHVYRDGYAYCSVFGSDPQVGIFGCGDSPEEAIMDWADDLDQRIEGLVGEDNAAHIAIEHLENIDDSDYLYEMKWDGYPLSPSRKKAP